MDPVRSMLLAFPVLAVVPLMAQGHLTAGAGVGLGYQSDTRYRSSNFGPAAHGFVSRRLSSRVALRGGLLLTYFDKTSQVLYASPLLSPCPPGALCEGPAGAQRSAFGVVAMTLGAVVSDTGAAAARSYLTIGGGLFGAYNHPAAEHRVFPGLTAGLGSPLGRGSLRLEIHYHWVPDWKGGGLSLGWVGLGKTF